MGNNVRLENWLKNKGLKHENGEFTFKGTVTYVGLLFSIMMGVNSIIPTANTRSIEASVVPVPRISISELYSKVSETANRVGSNPEDNMTGHDDWAKVYEFFEIPYDVHTSNPQKDLHRGQLENYLEANSL